MAKEAILTRQKLYELVWSKSMVQLAKEYNLSDVGLAKICKKYNIPRPGLGYWAKLEHGKPVVKTELPEEKDNPKILINIASEDEKQISEYHAQRKKADSLKEKYPIKEHLRNPHPLIAKARDVIGGKIKGDWMDRLSLEVGKEQLHRALRILDAVFKYLEERGHKIEISRGSSRRTRVYADIKGQKVGILIREKLNQIPHELTPKEKEDKQRYGFSAHKYDYVGSGKLVFRIIDDGYYSCKEIGDGQKRNLEDMIGLMLLRILQEARLLHRRQRDQKRQAIERHKQWLREQELQKKMEEEQRKIENLESQAANWRKSRQIREYLKATEEFVNTQRGGYEEGSEFNLWMKWAYGYADRIDPLKI